VTEVIGTESTNLKINTQAYSVL